MPEPWSTLASDGWCTRATDPKAGAVASLYELCSDPRLNHRLPVVAGLHAEQAGELLRSFFADRRG